MLAGGRASSELQAILRAEGDAGVVRRVEWLGQPSTLLASRQIVWDERSLGARRLRVFRPGVRSALARVARAPAGRMVFAGEHTSIKWQGYMNGAIESGPARGGRNRGPRMAEDGAQH